MDLSLDIYFQDGNFGVDFADANGDCVSCKGVTAEECVERLKPYLVDYIRRLKKEANVSILTKKVVAHYGHIDLTDKNVILFDEDTENREGVPCNVLCVKLDDDGLLCVDIDYCGKETWDIDDLSAYEVQLLVDKING